MYTDKFLVGGGNSITPRGTTLVPGSGCVLVGQAGSHTGRMMSEAGELVRPFRGRKPTTELC